MTQLPPDYEDRHRLALTICQHLSINPEHIDLGSLQIELGPDNQHRVTWTGHAHLNPDPDCTATTPAIYGSTHPDIPHRCHLTANHPDHHQCGICAAQWEPLPT